MVSVTAGLAKEVSLSTSIGFIGLTTGGTALGSVARINLAVLHAVPPCLVLDERAQLIKTPIAAPCPVLVPNPGPQVDALEVLKGDALLRAFSLQNKLLADAVINVPLKAILLAGQLAQSLSSGLGTTPLQFLAAA